MNFFTAGYRSNLQIIAAIFSTYCTNKHSAPLSKVKSEAADKIKSGAVGKIFHNLIKNPCFFRFLI